MSIGEIIAILALLIALLQTMIAWMSHEGIRLSLSSGEWIRLFIILMASAFIVGGLFQASSESLLVFFVGNFLMVELVILLDDWLQKSTVLAFLFMGPILLISLLPTLSHECMIRSVLTITKLLPSFCDSYSSNYINAIWGGFSFSVFLFTYLNLFLADTSNRLIIRLISWLSCGIGVCLGYWVRLIFF